MNRRDIILKHVREEAIGVEIGAGWNPIAPKREGFNVHVIDPLSREELIKKHEGHDGVDPLKIEKVDFIWRGESYAELTSREKHYDWIIASHVIEHTTDLIRFITDCDSILKDDGVLTLAVPDKRYIFDCYRPISGLAEIIDHHINKVSVPSPGTVAEYCLNVVSKGGKITWSEQDSDGNDRFLHTLVEAKEMMKEVIHSNTYYDVHCWRFVPHSFRLIIHDLHTLGFIPFMEVDFHPTFGCEFFMTLGRKGRGLEQSRLKILRTMQGET